MVNPYLLVLAGAGATALGQFVPTFDARKARRLEREHALDDRIYNDARAAYVGAVSTAWSMTDRLARTLILVRNPAQGPHIPPPVGDIEVEAHANLAIFGSDDVAAHYDAFWSAVADFSTAVEAWNEERDPVRVAPVEAAYAGVLGARKELGNAARDALTILPRPPAERRWFAGGVAPLLSVRASPIPELIPTLRGFASRRLHSSVVGSARGLGSAGRFRGERDGHAHGRADSRE